MDFNKIAKYISMTKELLDYRNKFGNDEQSEDLLNKMGVIWNDMSDEETLMVDEIFAMEFTQKQITGVWLDNEWFIPKKEANES
jgi:hypothetical protein